jgi:transposase
VERVSRRKIREVFRLKFDGGLSDRQIAQSVGIARSSVGQYLGRFHAASLIWQLSPALSDRDLEAALFPPPPAVAAAQRAVPEWPAVHQELRRKGVTLFLLWQEYKAACPEGFQYSWFCGHYLAWRGRCDRVMRELHRAGETSPPGADLDVRSAPAGRMTGRSFVSLFVDFAGQAVPLVDAATGEIRVAEIFVAVLGASNYTDAEAVASQALPGWIGAHVRAFDFFGGVPELLVPDNLAAGVRKACRYEPDLNPTYADLAAHYSVAEVPGADPQAPRQGLGFIMSPARWMARPYAAAAGGVCSLGLL